MVGKLSFNKNMSNEATDLEGAIGRVLILYNKKAFQISTIHNEGNSLLCKVSHAQSGDSWFILNVYAPNVKRERRVFWAKILDVIHNSNINKGVIWGISTPPLLIMKNLEGCPGSR